MKTLPTEKIPNSEPTEKILSSDEMAEILKEMEEFLSAPDTFTTTITRHEPIILSKHFMDVKNKKI